MINSSPDRADVEVTEDEAVRRIVGSGAAGAVSIAGIATALVIAMWVAFYLLVFMPRTTP